ncbi:MAG: HEAT repeat domain-containing protein [Bacteroidetes bacterium]|nr:HEAT repeat domain-containing protein [Bacteroidota bacterium]
MGLYDLSKHKRADRVEEINQYIAQNLAAGVNDDIIRYFADEDTYIRKAAYQTIGRLFKADYKLQSAIIAELRKLLVSESDHVRQTTINAAGEIGMMDFEAVVEFFDTGIFDHHHSVRNAVIGSLKKMAEKNPKPTLKWAKKYLHHEDKEIRREICHGLELRGRTHPQEVLPLLEQLQHDKSARVSKTLVHVIGQIAYKRGCLRIVINALNNWENQELVEKALDEIVSVHERYKNFATLTQQQAIDYIDEHYRGM